MFEDFDFSILDNPEFKEDSVREEIVSPLLNALGYSATEAAKIVRSKALTHPYVYIGTKRHQVNIVPDYFLHIDDRHRWILDAKSPKERIDSGKSVEQAFSYAIHPEVRAERYALCNGRELAVFSINRIEPLLHVKINELPDGFEEIAKLLSPTAFTSPHIFDYKPDFGLYLWKLGFTEETTWYFIETYIPLLAKVEDGLYSFSTAVAFGELELAASFDFDEPRYQELLSSVTETQSEKLRDALKRQPFMAHFEEINAPVVQVKAKLQSFFYSNEDEDYSPLVVENFEKRL